MDAKPTTATATATTTTDGTPSGQTLPHAQTIKLLSYPNGNSHRHPPRSTAASVYKECLKNHALTIGGHAVDGCGEFMPSATSTPTEPTSLNCAACGCHRSFHRRDSAAAAAAARTHFIEFHRPPPSPPQPQLLLSLGTAAVAEQNHTVATPGTPAATKIENPSGRKRFRTKFSRDQKEKMWFFAEKIGWRMQRCDDKTVADFCNDIGIRRGVFKVWMHNNKTTVRKREKDAIFPANTAGTAVGVSKSSESHENSGGGDGGGGGGGSGGLGLHLQVSTNGSCSSS